MSTDVITNIVAQWKADHHECEDSWAMLGECFNYSEVFARFARSNGFDAQVISGLVIVDKVILRGHAATLVDGIVYDWTNRQFDLDCSVPTITPLDEWRLTWEAPSLDRVQGDRRA